MFSHSTFALSETHCSIKQCEKSYKIPHEYSPLFLSLFLVRNCLFTNLIQINYGQIKSNKNYLKLKRNTHLHETMAKLDKTIYNSLIENRRNIEDFFYRL